MSIPSSITGFRSSGNNTPPAPLFRSQGESTSTTLPQKMPEKAAQILGTKSGTSSANGTPNKRRDQVSRPLQQVRSDTSKSLPSKLYNQPTHTRRPNHHGTATSRHRTPIRKPPSPKRGTQQKGAKVSVLEESISTSTLGVPPTPPEKDTPREESKAVGWALSKLSQDDIPENGEDEDSTLRLPTFLTTANPVPLEGGNSPTKFCPYGAGEYAELVEAPRVPSTHAQVDNEGVCELEGDIHHAREAEQAKVEMQEQYTGWWHKKGLKRYTQGYDDPKLHEAIQASQTFNGFDNVDGQNFWSTSRASESAEQTQGPSLPPRFYSPSTYSLRLFQDGHPSGNVSLPLLPFLV
ncbi:hypothetical protein K491DRAFT_264464 [Lophiostoma macrostomum CBS 122681]|uniref:Uncharacterized protein n=1 Tax=Lophiostoma macrostomum CBS 122681 TaxID=1314788 RepID=A0A6A6SNU3_9PLEO|nr:hypothetical protein K491DRAFT_264464 [Lophiostoma macrostomum CBS 122681]